MSDTTATNGPADPPAATDDYLSPAEFRRLLPKRNGRRPSLSSVYRWAAAGKLPGATYIGGVLAIPRAALAAYLRPVPAAAPAPRQRAAADAVRRQAEAERDLREMGVNW